MIKKILLLSAPSSTFMIMPTRERLPAKTKGEEAVQQHAYYVKRKLATSATSLPVSPKFNETNAEIVKLYQELRLTTADQNLRNFRKEYAQSLKDLSAIIPNKSSNKIYRQIYYKAYRSHLKAVYHTPEFKNYRKACQKAYKKRQELTEIFYEIMREES